MQSQSLSLSLFYLWATFCVKLANLAWFFLYKYIVALFSSSYFFLPFLCRRYGTKCNGCGQGIAPSDLVRKPRDKVYHLNCFTCCICRKQLSTGEQLYVLDDNKFVCKDNKSCKEFMLSKGYQIGEHSILLNISSKITQ